MNAPLHKKIPKLWLHNRIRNFFKVLAEIFMTFHFRKVVKNHILLKASRHNLQSPPQSSIHHTTDWLSFCEQSCLVWVLLNSVRFLFTFRYLCLLWVHNWLDALHYRNESAHTMTPILEFRHEAAIHNSSSRFCVFRISARLGRHESGWMWLHLLSRPEALFEAVRLQLWTGVGWRSKFRFYLFICN